MVLVLYNCEQKTKQENYQRERMKKWYSDGEYSFCICGCYVNSRNRNHAGTQVHRNALKKIKDDLIKFKNS